jgi:hypothetical protein
VKNEKRKVLSNFDRASLLAPKAFFCYFFGALGKTKPTKYEKLAVPKCFGCFQQTLFRALLGFRLFIYY